MKQLKKKVEDTADSLGMSRAQVVSRYLGVDYSTYYRWCSGRTQPGSVARRRIADFLNGKRTDIPEDVAEWMTSLTSSDAVSEDVRKTVSDLLDVSHSDCMCNT